MGADVLTRGRREAPLQPAAAAPSIHRARSRSRRAVLLTWLRKTHLYVGLWGAALGLLFGATGILMNHRSIMKIPVEKAIQKTAQVPVPGSGFTTPAQMSEWLRRELSFTAEQVTHARSQPAQKIVWGDREVWQPERWSFSLHSPSRGVNAEYFVGNRFVRLDQIDATPIGTVLRLHMSVGASAFWVLLSDTIAGSLVLLSITGLLLWTQLHTIRTLAVMTSLAALLAGTWFLWFA